MNDFIVLRLGLATTIPILVLMYIFWFNGRKDLWSNNGEGSFPSLVKCVSTWKMK